MKKKIKNRNNLIIMTFSTRVKNGVNTIGKNRSKVAHDRRQHYVKPLFEKNSIFFPLIINILLAALYSHLHYLFLLSYVAYYQLL